MPRGNRKIKELRRSRGLSQLDLAMKADVSSRTVQFAESGKKSMTRDVLEAIADALEVKYEDVVDDGDDAFLEWPWGLSRIIQKRCLPESMSRCSSLEDAELAIRRMRDSWQQHLEGTGSHRATTIFGRADQILDREYDDYETRYLAIWKQNNATIHFGTCDAVRTGLTVVLPVSDTAYEALRDGKISFMEVTQKDILQSSHNLILDSAVEFRDAPTKRWYQLTDALSFAVFHQIATLSTSPGSHSFRLLSFGASPINLNRLKSTGFVTNGNTMPKFGFPLCEFTGDNSDLDVDTYNKQSTLRHFVRLWQRMLPPRMSLRAKRKAIMKALQTYKAIAIRYGARVAGQSAAA